MSLGGIIAGLLVALLAGMTSRATGMKEDASLAGFYLASLALGVLIVSAAGSSVDLLHILFGSILAVDDEGLLLVVGDAEFTPDGCDVTTSNASTAPRKMPRKPACSMTGSSVAGPPSSPPVASRIMLPPGRPRADVSTTPTRSEARSRR